jgi:hypothetical protein
VLSCDLAAGFPISALRRSRHCGSGSLVVLAVLRAPHTRSAFAACLPLSVFLSLSFSWWRERLATGSQRKGHKRALLSKASTRHQHSTGHTRAHNTRALQDSLTRIPARPQPAGRRFSFGRTPRFPSRPLSTSSLPEEYKVRRHVRLHFTVTYVHSCPPSPVLTLCVFFPLCVCSSPLSSVARRVQSRFHVLFHCTSTAAWARINIKNKDKAHCSSNERKDRSQRWASMSGCVQKQAKQRLPVPHSACHFLSQCCLSRKTLSIPHLIHPILPLQAVILRPALCAGYSGRRSASTWPRCFPAAMARRLFQRSHPSPQPSPPPQLSPRLLPLPAVAAAEA